MRFIYWLTYLICDKVRKYGVYYLKICTCSRHNHHILHNLLRSHHIHRHILAYWIKKIDFNIFF